MPLRDHFHAPLYPTYPWEGFHARWASAIADALNVSLPEYYLAFAQIHDGPRIEVDVATLQGSSLNRGGTTAAVLAAPALSPPQAVVPVTLPAEFAVHVVNQEGGTKLAASIELVSPGNKDRPEQRRAFASKCHGYISKGLGLVVIDIVTNRRARPFDELMALLDPGVPPPASGPLTASSFRPLRTDVEDTLEVRLWTLDIGSPLPTTPLALGGAGHVFVDLESAYEEARTRGRLP